MFRNDENHALTLKVVRKVFGFKSFEIMKIALYHQLGKLPEQKFTHEFW